MTLNKEDLLILSLVFIPLYVNKWAGHSIHYVASSVTFCMAVRHVTENENIFIRVVSECDLFAAADPARSPRGQNPANESNNGKVLMSTMTTMMTT